MLLILKIIVAMPMIKKLFNNSISTDNPDNKRYYIEHFFQIKKSIYINEIEEMFFMVIKLK